MPEIHYSETDVRKRLGIPSEKANPDLKVRDKWVDVKSPFNTFNIVRNANQAAEQGSIACITDDHCIISQKDAQIWAKKVFDDINYTQDVIYFIIDGKPIKIQRPKHN